MWWIGVLIVAPLWGMVSTQLFLQAWLAFINGIICIVGFFAGRVGRKATALGIGVGLGMAIFFSLLLREVSGYCLTFYTLDIAPARIRFIGFSLHSQLYICSPKFQAVLRNHGESRWLQAL